MPDSLASYPPQDAQIADLLNIAWEEARQLPRVVAFLDEVPRVTPEEVARRGALPADQHAFFTHEVGGQPVSLVEVTVSGDSHGEIGWFGTHPAHRRRGYGSRCLQAGLSFLLAHGVREVRTAGIIDSRLPAQCAFLEANAFEHRDADRENMVMQTALEAYQLRDVQLPAGYSFVTLTPELIADWGAVKDGVFGGETPPEWFQETFAHRWDFDPEGWFLLDHEGQKVGISGADIFRDAADHSRITGCQIEYVGVLAEHRGKRLGEALVAHCLNYAKRLDAAPCQLITQEFRVPAVTLYESLGFRRVRQNRIYSLSLTP
jgi:ribosomal protein S18 acetylase RimI-like enzyme